MNVVDSSAWIAWFRGDSHAGHFARPIRDLERLIVPTITLTEVFKYLARFLEERDALLAVAHMQQGMVVPLDAPLAVNAAVFGRELKLPLADSIVYATARRFDAVVWTRDANFKGLDKVRYFS